MLSANYDLLKEKKGEIISVIEQTNISLEKEQIDSEEILQSLQNSDVLLLTAPQQEIPMMELLTTPQQEMPVMQFLTVNSLNNYNKGTSIKPGNIILNIRNLIISLPELITNISDFFSKDSPVYKEYVVLNILKKIKHITTIEITEDQSLAVLALWRNYNQHQRIKLEEGFERCRTLYKSINKPTYTFEQYLKVIDDLEKIGSLHLNDDGILLCELVNIKY